MLKKIIIMFGLILLNLNLSHAYAFLHVPKTIEIGTTFNGATLHISGEVPTGDNVIVEILGTDKQEAFKLKGKVWGIFWMTVGHYEIKGLPSLYLVYLPKSLSHLSNDKLKNLNFGFEEVYSRFQIEPEPKDKRFIFNEFLKLKQKEKLYGIVHDSVTYSNITSQKKKYHAEVMLPPKIMPGIYTIKIYKVSPQFKIDGVDTDNFKVKLVGFPAFISKMAFEHSLWYGILAVIIAIMAGVLMSALFKGGGAH